MAPSTTSVSESKPTSVTTSTDYSLITKPNVPTTPTAATQKGSINIWMPNPNLRKAVLKALRGIDFTTTKKVWNSEDDITQNDLHFLTDLELLDTYHSGDSTTTDFSLKGLQYAKNLTKLTLSSGLNATPVHYHGNISSIDPLAQLTNLTYLELSMNKIKNISKLSGLIHLKTLYLNYNYISNFSSLSGIYRQLTDFKYGSQLITLPLLYVDNQTHTATLKTPIVLPDGKRGDLSITPGKTIIDTANYDNPQDTSEDIVHAYYVAGSPSPNTTGGIDFVGLTNPIKTTTPIQDHNIITYPGYDQYLLGEIPTSNPQTPLFYVVQPYQLANEAGSVTTSYQDDHGSPLTDSNVDTSGIIGNPYVTHELSFPNYHLHYILGNPIGTYTNTPITVTYIYTKNVTTPVIAPPVVTPTLTGTVNIHYVSDQGTTLQPSQTLTGETGTSYTTNAPNIAGYVLSQQSANTTGIFTATDQIVTYIYALAPTSSGNSDNGNDLTPSPAALTPTLTITTPATGAAGANKHPGHGQSQPVTSIVITHDTSHVISEKPAIKSPAMSVIQPTTLPQTGETFPSIWVATLGLILSGLSWFTLRRHH